MRRIAMVMLLALGCGGGSAAPAPQADAAVAQQDADMAADAAAVDVGQDAPPPVDASQPLPDGSEPVIPTPTALIGTWGLTTTTGCAIDYGFNANNTYAWGVLCVLPDSTFGFDVESGTFVTSAHRIEFTPAKATCPSTTSMPYVKDYTVSSTALAISDPSTILLFSPAPTGSGGLAATYGCYASGVFTPSPYIAVP